MNLNRLSEVLSLYKHQFAGASPSICYLANNGGYSGADLWKIKDAEAAFCLRCWPRQMQDRSKLMWIHHVLNHAFKHGCKYLATPLVDAGGDSLIRFQDRFWQLEHWMPGEASFWDSPTNQKLENAMFALAEFHKATAALREADRPSNSIQNRIHVLHGWWAGGNPTNDLLELEALVSRNSNDPLSDFGRAICSRFRKICPEIGRHLYEAASVNCLAQPIFADIWHDHVLFSGSKVTGVVDFGAMRVDSPAGDVARLLGSLVGDDRQRWEFGLEVYKKASETTHFDEKLVSIFDRSTTLLAGMNWLRWLFLDRTEFDAKKPILNRLERIQSRLDCLCSLFR